MKFNCIKQEVYIAPNFNIDEIDAISVLCVSGDGTTEDLTIDENYGW